MPMSMTSQPLPARPRASAATSSGPDSRPSRPTTTRVWLRARAALPMAWPMRSTIAGVSVFPTIPRMS
jgi:hypothetical protein